MYRRIEKPRPGRARKQRANDQCTCVCKTFMLDLIDLPLPEADAANVQLEQEIDIG